MPQPNRHEDEQHASEQLPRKEAETAELIQSLKALFIPSSLFLACVMMAAGMFLLYNGEPLGWAFAVVSLVVMITSFIALLRFQNKYRAQGIPKEADDAIDDRTQATGDSPVTKPELAQLNRQSESQN